jgi:hypothetical protein
MPKMTLALHELKEVALHSSLNKTSKECTTSGRKLWGFYAK